MFLTMPKARVAAQQDGCPWRRLSHMTLLIGIVGTGQRKQDVSVVVKDSHIFCAAAGACDLSPCLETLDVK